MILAHKIRLDPTCKQAKALSRACGVARFTYNWALAEWTKQYESGQKSSTVKLKKQWNQIKGEQFPWVYDSPKGANQRPFMDLQKAFSGFFKKKTKYPKFKKKFVHDSFYVENDKFRFDSNTHVRLPKIGLVKIREKLRFEGKIMGAAVSRVADHWFIAVQVDVSDFRKTRTGDGIAGVDLGLITAATIATGGTKTIKIKSPKPLKRALSKLRLISRKLSRQQKGSKRREKTRRRLARLHYRVGNIRRDFAQKLTTRICRENQTAVIEDLNVKGMLSNHCLARSLSDTGFSEIRRELMYKSPIYSMRLVVADRWFPSSKQCRKCLHVNKNLSLRDRIFACPKCNHTEDRDDQAAYNLRTLGLRETYAQGEATASSILDELRTNPCSQMNTI